MVHLGPARTLTLCRAVVYASEVGFASGRRATGMTIVRFGVSGCPGSPAKVVDRTSTCVSVGEGG
jgi:hypothetical protein